MIKYRLGTTFYNPPGVPVPQPAHLDDETADTSADEPEMNGFAKFYEVFKFLNDAWYNAWQPGSILVCDESMAAWEGATQAHLTLIPRKPTPLGFMFKVTCCASSKVLIFFEPVEGKLVDRNKKWVEDFGATTACTLRLVENWRGGGFIVIADSWFGSTRTAEELLELGFYSVLSIKRGCKDYPKAELLA